MILFNNSAVESKSGPSAIVAIRLWRIVIAAVIALAGLWTIGNTMSPLIGGGLVAVASWLLSEYFTRRRHMALPSIVLLRRHWAVPSVA